MMEYHVRLDSVGRGSYSTALVAEIGQQSLHWGSASDGGNSVGIVTLKWGFIAITVDDKQVGKQRLQAMENASGVVMRRKPEQPAPTEPVDPVKRREAAEAALAADDFKLASEIDPAVLFASIVRAIMAHYAKSMNADSLSKLIEQAHRHADTERASSFEIGRSASKHELRSWLGVGGGRGTFDDDR